MLAPSFKVAVLHCGMKKFHSLQRAAALPLDFINFKKQLHIKMKLLNMRENLFDDIYKEHFIWHHSFEIREVLQIAQRYADETAGPRDLWLWSQLYHRLRPGSPLRTMTSQGDALFFDGDTTHPTAYLRFPPYGWFGCPHMGKYSFLDRDTLERSRPYPTMNQLIEEAEAMAEARLVESRESLFEYGQLTIPDGLPSEH